MLNIISFIVAAALFIWYVQRHESRTRSLLETLKQKDDLISELKREIGVLEKDPNTGALQRVSWEKKVREKLQENPQMICVIDLNDFKQINDTYGHPVGDKILNIFVATLDSNLKNGDLIGRYGGGDEFLIALDADYLGQDELDKKVSQIFRRMEIEYRDAVSTYFYSKWCRASELSVGFSYGAVWMDRGRRDIEKHIGLADTEMYKQKAAHKSLVI